MVKGAPGKSRVDLRPWVSLEVGNQPADVVSLMKGLNRKGVGLDELDCRVITFLEWEYTEPNAELSLVTCTGYDLGFEAEAYPQDIFGSARALGLRLCPQQVGLILRMQYWCQPNDEWLIVASKPIMIPGSGGGYFLEVGRTTENVDGRISHARKLRASEAECGWRPENRWVFALMSAGK